jgi:hypothetical protein
MYSYRAFVTFGTLAFAMSWSTVAQGSEDIALSFALEPIDHSSGEDVDALSAEADTAIMTTVTAVPTDSPDAPLPIPQGAESPPVSSDTTFPAGVYGGINALALGNTSSVQTLLPAPPPAPTLEIQVANVVHSVPPKDIGEAKADSTSGAEFIQELVGLSFEPKKPAWLQPDTSTIAASSPPPAEGPQTIANAAWDAIQTLFEGGTDSLVARAVGSAEGTRTPEGHKNPAYFGHTDPGNGVWNLGTFSYQHGARTPEEADAKQLARLKRQTKSLHQKAQSQNLDLSFEELLNGIDLANQAPEAALDNRGSYLDWLKQARDLGMTGSEAIVWARTRSFIDPDTQRWNAPGLGNNVYSISHDQERRAKAIARALNAQTPSSNRFLAAATISGDHSLGLSAKRSEQPAIDTEPEQLLNIERNFALDLALSPAASSSVEGTVVAIAHPKATKETNALAVPLVDTVEAHSEIAADTMPRPSTRAAFKSPTHTLTRVWNTFWQPQPPREPLAESVHPKVANALPLGERFSIEEGVADLASTAIDDSHASQSETAVAAPVDHPLDESTITNSSAEDVATTPAIAPPAPISMVSRAENPTMAPEDSVVDNPPGSTRQTLSFESVDSAAILTEGHLASDAIELADVLSLASAQQAERPAPAAQQMPVVDAAIAPEHTKSMAADHETNSSPVASLNSDVKEADTEVIQDTAEIATGLLPTVKQSATVLKHSAESTAGDVIESLEKFQRTLRAR